MRKRKSIPWEDWSATKLNSLSVCPLAFCFFYVLHIVVPKWIGTIFGEGIHQMTKWFFKKTYKSVKTFIGTWQHYYWEELLGKRYKNLVRVKNPDETKKFFAIGISILEKFYLENLPYRTGELPKPKVEKRFNQRFKEHRINGKIDRIQPVGSGEMEIWDYKTSLRKFTERERIRDKQFTFYNLLFLLFYGKNPIGMRIDHLFYGEQSPVPIRTEKDYLQLAHWLDEGTVYVANILRPTSQKWKQFPFRWLNPEDIERKYFSPRPSYLCNFCDYEQICREYYPKEPIREKWVKQELDKIGPDLGHIQLELSMSKPKAKRRKRKPSW